MLAAKLSSFGDLSRTGSGLLLCSKISNSLVYAYSLGCRFVDEGFQAAGVEVAVRVVRIGSRPPELIESPGIRVHILAVPVDRAGLRFPYMSQHR